MNNSAAAFSDEFHDYFFRRSRWLVCAGFVFLGLNYLLSDIAPTNTFGLPAEIPLAVRLAERGIIIPVSFAVALLLAIRGERRYMQGVVIYSALLVGCAVILGRRFWELEGEYFPGDYSMFIPCALAAVTAIGPRIWIVAAPMLLLNLVSAYAVHGVSPTANFEAISIVSAWIVVAAINWQLRNVVMLVWQEREQFGQLAHRDPLTHLPNRRAFETHANAALGQAARDGVAVAVAMIDLDAFKPYNDHYGHPAGDAVLAAVGRVLSGQVQRPMDLAARIGGEEFACFWYGVTPEGARQLGEAVVASIQALALPHAASPVAAVVTASVGLHTRVPAAAQALSPLLQAADAALYEAKAAGRNRVAFST